MATITTRAGKGSPLTNDEVDANFTNLNTDKAELSGASFTGNVSFGDNDKAIFGGGSDLAIYHDGSNSHVRDQGTGNLQIEGQADVKIMDNLGATTMAVFRKNGSVFLNHNNVEKFATTSTGIDVTGTIVGDGLTVDGDSTVDAITYTANSSFPTTGVSLNSNGFSYEMAGTQGKIFRSASNTKALMQITNDGDISFYEDTGTTAKLFWDASAESLGIGTTSPTELLTVNGGNIQVDAFARKIGFKVSGNSNAGYLIPYDGDGNTQLVNERSTGNLIFKTADTERMRIESDGNLRVYDVIDNITNTLTLNGRNTGQIHFQSGGTEKMRMDASGNLLVGGTNDNPAGANVAGHAFGASGYISTTRDGGFAAFLNRKTSDGEIVRFGKDGSTVGSIGVSASDNFYIGATSANHTGLSFSDNNIVPMVALSNSDATTDLGASAVRFKDLYLSGGVYLGGTGSANKLDDYEEGTWTPALAGTTTAGTFSGNVYGRYTKIGNLVYITLRMTAVTLSGAAGGIKITGLPFASNVANDNYGVTQSMQLYKINFDSSRLQTFYVSGSILLGLESRSGTTWATWDVTNSTDMYMNLTAVYDVA